MFVLVGEDIIEKEITFTPGLFKIFDEIVVNAADNKQRDPNMDKLDITIDAKANLISVKNNGKGIPIVMHKEHGVYIPTMIFGQLLTGSNFDDKEDKTTGGRNGYGAKLANVFSTEFIVECIDVENGLFFHQVFRDNMSVAEPATVKNLTAVQKKAGDSVKITFSPDLPRFKMTNLDEDTVSLLSKRAYDMAGSMANKDGKKLIVSLNDQKLSIRSFKEYLAKFRDVSAPVAYEKSERWEVGVTASNDAQMTQISFVNAICTSKGGGHVTYIADQIAAHLVKVLKKKSKGGTELKKCQIVNHLTIMVNCLITNPAFDSQTKNFLTTRPKQFGSEFKLSDKFLKAVEKSDIASKILDYASFRQNQALKRKGGVKKVKLTGISKLDDANNAGTAKSRDCTLIITEGDSAKSLAMAGLSVIGRDFYGVFPLRGKPMNVRDAKTAAVVSNEEIKNLVDIMGLKFGTIYDESNITTLRYGHLMIMADQDTDGSHIKGLVINFIHSKFCFRCEQVVF
jgi:DNA topoisomerase II